MGAPVDCLTPERCPPLPVASLYPAAAELLTDGIHCSVELVITLVFCLLYVSFTEQVRLDQDGIVGLTRKAGNTEADQTNGLTGFLARKQLKTGVDQASVLMGRRVETLLSGDRLKIGPAQLEMDSARGAL